MTDKIVTAEEMRHYDFYTINTIGIPSLVLMERAALAVRDEILHTFPIALKDVVVVAGSGNNGGDGIAIARLLHIAGVHVTILSMHLLNTKHKKKSRNIIKFPKPLISLSLIRQH